MTGVLAGGGEDADTRGGRKPRKDGSGNGRDAAASPGTARTSAAPELEETGNGISLWPPNRPTDTLTADLRAPDRQAAFSHRRRSFGTAAPARVPTLDTREVMCSRAAGTRQALQCWGDPSARG